MRSCFFSATLLLLLPIVSLAQVTEPQKDAAAAEAEERAKQRDDGVYDELNKLMFKSLFDIMSYGFEDEANKRKLKEEEMKEAEKMRRDKELLFYKNGLRTNQTIDSLYKNVLSSNGNNEDQDALFRYAIASSAYIKLDPAYHTSGTQFTYPFMETLKKLANEGHIPSKYWYGYFLSTEAYTNKTGQLDEVRKYLEGSANDGYFNAKEPLLMIKTMIDIKGNYEDYLLNIAIENGDIDPLKQYYKYLNKMNVYVLRTVPKNDKRLDSWVFNALYPTEYKIGKMKKAYARQKQSDNPPVLANLIGDIYSNELLSASAIKSYKAYKKNNTWPGSFWETKLKNDFNNAVEWYIKSAQSGLAGSYHDAGKLYDDNPIIEFRDYNKAAQYYQEAINNGIYKSCAYLGKMYEEGRGVDKNMEKALALYDMGIKAGHKEAFFNLWYLHEEKLPFSASVDIFLSREDLNRIIEIHPAKKKIVFSSNREIDSDNLLKSIRFKQLVEQNGNSDLKLFFVNCDKRLLQLIDYTGISFITHPEIGGSASNISLITGDTKNIIINYYGSQGMKKMESLIPAYLQK